MADNKTARIQAGKYRARAQASSVQFGENGRGGEYIAITFDLLDDDDKPNGNTIPWMGFFTEKAEALTVESLGHCGWDMAKGPSHAKRVSDNVVEIVVSERSVKGKPVARVDWVNRAPAKATRRTLDEKRKNSLFERIASRASEKV